jgi:hypothetical protein
LDTYPGQFPLVLKGTTDAKLVIRTGLRGVAKEFGENSRTIYVNEPQEVIATALELARSGKVKHESAMDGFETTLNDTTVDSPRGNWEERRIGEVMWEPARNRRRIAALLGIGLSARYFSSRGLRIVEVCSKWIATAR